MKRVVLFPHGGSGNHGCEAIVRTTAKLLESAEIFLFSENVDEDKKYLGDIGVSICNPHSIVKKYSLSYFAGKYRTIVKKETDAMDVLSFSPILDLCDKDTVLLSIGGDNYCYGDNEYILLVNREARKKGAKTVLWGASVDEALLSDKMRGDLQGYSLIIARESLSYKYLKSINNNTMLLPDPAFSLEKKPGNAEQTLFNREVIGINVSPMVIGYESSDNIVFENYQHLITKLLQTTETNIALIPHVVWNHSDDRIPLKRLFDEFKDSGRVFMIQDQNCMQLKDIISKCSFFVGARTHSTIAAYSTCVPTLVVGYSIKARGIAIDLFGSEQEYVLPVQALKNKTDLYEAFVNLYAKREDISAVLSTMNKKLEREIRVYNTVI